jgi:GxxExxY protein
MVLSMTDNEISKQIVDTAYKIQTTFGPGLLESVYETLMAYEPTRTGLHVVRQQAIPVVYESVHMELGFRADLIVEGKVVVDRVRRDGGARSQEAIADSLAPC